MSIETFCKSVLDADGPVAPAVKAHLDQTLGQFADYVAVQMAEKRPKKPGKITGACKPATTDEDEVEAEPKVRVNTSAAPTRKEQAMDTVEAAHRVAKGERTAATRKDFYRAIEKLAEDYRRDHPTERLTPERAFCKIALDTDDGRALFKAHRLSPGNDYELATPKMPDPVAVAPSLAKLNGLAHAVRAGDPTLTFEQAFAKVYEDPANRALVAAEKAER
jgi:hypothetical protein